MKKLNLLLCILIVLVISCNNKDIKNKSTEENETENIKELVKSWNNYLSNQELDSLKKMYNDKVTFYGQDYTVEEVISSKESYFKKNPDFYQQIFGEIEVEKIDENTVKCNFVKRVTLNQETKDYPSYLIFQKTENFWKIKTESDLTSDKNTKDKTNNNKKTPKDAIKGDYNGDGKSEYMWLVEPKINDEKMDCNGDCNCFIEFSDNNIPSLKVTGCIGGTPINEGDLNNNGTDEVSIIPDWFTSNWRTCYVWTLIKGKWINAIEPFSVWIGDESNEKLIEKDKKRDGYVIIRYNDMGDTENAWTKKTKSIKILK